MTGDVSCSGKKRFPTYWQASRSAKSLNYYRDKAKANVYKCSICRLWHVGNSMKGHRYGERKQTTDRNREIFEDTGLFCDGDSASGWYSDWDE